MDDSSDDALVQTRRDKAARIRERAQNPFANDVDLGDRSLVRGIRAIFEAALLEPKSELRYDPSRVEEIGRGKTFHVLGRLMARRGFGKASFLQIRDDSGSLQLFAKQDVLGERFAALEDVDIADHVEARGPAMVTKTGELTIQL